MPVAETVRIRTTARFPQRRAAAVRSVEEARAAVWLYTLAPTSPRSSLGRFGATAVGTAPFGTSTESPLGHSWASRRGRQIADANAEAATAACFDGGLVWGEGPSGTLVVGMNHTFDEDATLGSAGNLWNGLSSLMVLSFRS